MMTTSKILMIACLTGLAGATRTVLAQDPASPPEAAPPGVTDPAVPPATTTFPGDPAAPKAPDKSVTLTGVVKVNMDASGEKVMAMYIEPVGGAALIVAVDAVAEQLAREAKDLTVEVEATDNAGILTIRSYKIVSAAGK
jgi:hypothetical protein